VIADERKEWLGEHPSERAQRFGRAGQKILSQEECPPPEDESGGCSYGSVKRWSKKVKSTGGCVFELDKLIVPVNVSNSHWCLAVAHARERRLQYYDSMGGQGRRYPGGLRLFLQGEAKKYNGDAGVDVANWEVVPTQVWGPCRGAARLAAGQQ